MNEITLADVLEGYAVETPEGNDANILRKWIKDYPHFAAELMDFAASRAIVRFAPEEGLSADEERHYQEVGLKNLRAFFPKSVVPQSIPESLTDLAKKKGLNKAKFASALGISISLLMYLEKRRLEFATVPQTIVKNISDLLETGEGIISSYLNQPPDLAGSASFKTATRPEDIKLKSFSNAVREDQTLSSEEKRKLLDLS